MTPTGPSGNFTGQTKKAMGSKPGLLNHDLRVRAQKTATAVIQVRLSESDEPEFWPLGNRKRDRCPSVLEHLIVVLLVNPRPAPS
jgi:hypothetical protein